MTLTKQDLDAIRIVVHESLDGRVLPIAKDIGDLKSDIVLIKQEVNELHNEVSALCEQIQQLTITLDNFVKMMTDYKEEFTILKAEVDQIKRVLKEKLGVQIAVQG